MITEAESEANVKINNFNPIIYEATNRGCSFYIMHLFTFHITEHFHNHTDDTECELFLALFYLLALLYDHIVFIYFDLLLLLQAFITYTNNK
jgi:hypothetical protein